MAYFAAVLEYTTDADRLNEVRPTHRAYLQELLDVGKLESSGPFVDGSGALIIYDAEDLAEAQTLLANDPFSKAGLITGATVREWKLVFMREG
ncbi:MAG: YciI family protein [Thermomicrobiales bacterium]|nr:YciI family protein [Thermomicrobiales bacterium]MCO5227819.1 YciI family protein [Thermomicrobiales bacterium]